MVLTISREISKRDDLVQVDPDNRVTAPWRARPAKASFYWYQRQPAGQPASQPASNGNPTD